MNYLLFPGRHLVNTKFQEQYLKSVLTQPPAALSGLIIGASVPSTSPTAILFAITSANQENSRFNPIPFHIRAVGVDRFARQLQSAVPFHYRIFGVPHYGHTRNFAAFTVKEIEDQSEQEIRLTPENCLVLCSTPEVIKLYQQLGFSIAPAEMAEPNVHPTTPIQMVQQIGAHRGDWRSAPLADRLAESHVSLFGDFPEIPVRIARLYQDPVTNDEGSLTETRNYSTYARGMNEIIRLKYLDIHHGIKPGRIVDEGCSDGAMLAEISRDYPDSDLYGIDLSAEFAGRFRERQRACEFGGAYVHFFHRNLLDRVFEAESIDTTICNSTLHELWSYAEQEKTVRCYLAEKFRQLRPHGRLIIRDVVGPEDPVQRVLLHCSSRDGESLSQDVLEKHPDRSRAWLERLSTQSRFWLFRRDFLANKHRNHGEVLDAALSHAGELSGFLVTMRDAAEFLSKKDYSDNWLSEMNEEFCFWSFSRWKQILSETGFQVIENPNQPESGSRCYVNPWIMQHRYANHVALYSLEGKALLWPPTNMVLIAEKPRA